MWHRTRPRRDAGRREHVGAHPWVRLPAAAGAVPDPDDLPGLDDLPGPVRAHHLPSGAFPLASAGPG